MNRTATPLGRHRAESVNSQQRVIAISDKNTTKVVLFYERNKITIMEALQISLSSCNAARLQSEYFRNLPSCDFLEFATLFAQISLSRTLGQFFGIHDTFPQYTSEAVCPIFTGTFSRIFKIINTSLAALLQQVRLAVKNWMISSNICTSTKG